MLPNLLLIYTAAANYLSCLLYPGQTLAHPLAVSDLRCREDLGDCLEDTTPVRCTLVGNEMEKGDRFESSLKTLATRMERDCNANNYLQM